MRHIEPSRPSPVSLLDMQKGTLRTSQFLTLLTVMKPDREQGRGNGETTVR